MKKYWYFFIRQFTCPNRFIPHELGVKRGSQPIRKLPETENWGFIPRSKYPHKYPKYENDESRTLDHEVKAPTIGLPHDPLWKSIDDNTKVKDMKGWIFSERDWVRW